MDRTALVYSNNKHLPVIQYDIWYPDLFGHEVDRFDSSVLRGIPCEVFIVPILNRREKMKMTTVCCYYILTFPNDKMLVQIDGNESLISILNKRFVTNHSRRN